MKQQSVTRKIGRGFKATFRELLAETREGAAERIWERARAASNLRHASRALGRRRQARSLAQMKRSLILKAIELAPKQIRVTVDDDYLVGLLSIRWRGHGQLHLPANTQLPKLCVMSLPFVANA